MALPGGGEINVHDSVRLLERAGVPLPTDLAPGSTAWLQALVDGLCQISSRDPLTGLANRRHFEISVGREIDRSARTGEAALMLLADIDHFKGINDRYGHAVGDHVLKEVALVLNESVRPMDTVARVGGEEFAVIMPNCGPSFGRTVAERLCKKVGRHQIRVPMGPTLTLTISLGGAFAPQWVRSLPQLWVERADAQLYLAKAQGRNRVCLEQPPVLQVSPEERGMLFGLHRGEAS